MIIKKTYLQLIEFNIASGKYLMAKGSEDNKLSSAIKLINKQLGKIFEDYNDEVDTIKLNNCLVDNETQAILYDIIPGVNGRESTRERKYSVSGQIKIKSELKNLGKKQVQIHSRIVENCEDLISKLTDDQKEAFSELIIPKFESN